MYLGNTPANSYTSFAKQDFTTSATTSYTLDNPVTNANELALFINFVRQEPTTAYSASGTSLTLTSATASSDDMYCVYLGKALQTVNPPNASVGLSQLTATGTKNSTTFLRGDNTFASAGGVNTPMFQANLSGNQSLNAGATTKISFNTETFDTAGAYNTSTYRFTPQTAGKYLIEVSLQFAAGSSQLLYCYTYIYKNGAGIKISLNDFQSNPANTHNATASYIVDMNGSSDYVEAYGHIYNAGNVEAVNGSSKSSVFKGYKLIT